MEITPISSNSTKVSPPPINKVIVENGIPTQTFIRYLLDLRSSNQDYSEIINEIIEEVTALQNGVVIINIDEDTELNAATQTVLVNASSGAINITLPDPAECFNDNRSFSIAIHKTDTTANTVTILPNDSELVVGETSQNLLLDGEIYNFITDGTNWYLGA